MDVTVNNSTIMKIVFGESFFYAVVKNRRFVHVVPDTSQGWSGVIEFFVVV